MSVWDTFPPKLLNGFHDGAVTTTVSLAVRWRLLQGTRKYGFLRFMLLLFGSHYFKMVHQRTVFEIDDPRSQMVRLPAFSLVYERYEFFQVFQDLESPGNKHGS